MAALAKPWLFWKLSKRFEDFCGMNNTSATGGYLRGSPLPVREETENIFHDLIAGITGLDSSMIRPFWQHEAAGAPDKEEN
jgi:hypothetical protein